jgi:hypothetical protein
MRILANGETKGTPGVAVNQGAVADGRVAEVGPWRPVIVPFSAFFFLAEKNHETLSGIFGQVSRKMMNHLGILTTGGTMVQFNTKDNEILVKIVYYGPGLSGKTTNLQKLHELMDPTQKTDLFSVNTMEDRTLFFDLLPVDLGYIYGNSIKLQIYTVPGQVHYDSTRRIVLSGADGVIFIADSDRTKLHDNIQSVNNLYHNLQANRINIKEIPLVMQWNKRDLSDVHPVEVLEKKLNFRKVQAFEAVAITGEGVLETFAEAVRQTVSFIFEKYQLSKSIKNPGELIQRLNDSIMAKARQKALADEKQAASRDVVNPKPRFGGKTVLKYTHTIEDDDRSSQEQLLKKALTSNMETARLYTDLQNSQRALAKKNEEMGILFKQLEKTNQENGKMRRFLESLVNFAGDAIVSFNDLWVIQNWNQAAETLFGYKRADILNKNVNTLFPESGMAELNRIIPIVTNGKVVRGFETQMVDQGGRAIPVSATFSPIKNKNETIIAFTAIIRDLSAFTQMQQHLFAVQRFESLGTFLPVAMEVLEDPKADAEFRQRVARLIRDASDTNYATSTIDLNQFIQDLKTLYEETLASTGVQWKTQLNPHLPQLNLNRSGVVQVILNLFLNAVEFSKGIQGASITIGTHFMDQEVLLQMINTGRGMPPEIMDQLFSPGQQAEVLTQNLRLRTARQLLNQMNALMRVDSHPEKGTKVTVKIKMPPT